MTTHTGTARPTRQMEEEMASEAEAASRIVKEFEPRDLPGYRVFQDRLTGEWCFTRPAGVPHSFSWSDETCSHSVPVFNDWWEGGRKTAKGAVAAAHAHDAWVKSYDPEREAVKNGLRKVVTAQ